MGDTSDIRKAVSNKTAYDSKSSTRTIALTVLVIILCIASFIGGISYQKAHASANTISTANTNGGAGGGFGGGGGRRLGAFGQVTAISSASITINNTRSGASSTYSISSGTTITDNGQSVAYSSIQAGDTVLISVASSGSTAATKITVNPSFGGGGATGTSAVTN